MPGEKQFLIGCIIYLIDLSPVVALAVSNYQQQIDGAAEGGRKFGESRLGGDSHE